MGTIPCMVLSLILGGSLFSQTLVNTPDTNLKLSTKVIDQKYCDVGYADMATLQMSLQLTYTNVSQQPLILHKGSNLIYYILIGSNQSR